MESSIKEVKPKNMPTKNILTKTICLTITILFTTSVCNAETFWSKFTNKDLGCPNIENNFSLQINDKIASPKVYTDVDISTFNDTSSHTYTKFVLGFTQGSSKLSSKLKFKYIKKNNKYCVWLNDIELNFEIDKLDVYIPSDFKNNSCKYKEIEKHEFEHVNIHKKTFHEYLNKLKELFKNYENKKDDAILVKQIETAKEIYQEELNSILEKFQNDYHKELNKRQQQIDTEENYKEIASRCKKWL